MSNISLELDCARAILKTYHQVHDNSTFYQKNPSHIRKKEESTFSENVPESAMSRETALENEIRQLKEQYAKLQHELSDRTEHLARLERQLQEGSQHMARLQEDYENAIYQLTRAES